VPEVIRPLARRNAVRMTRERFRADAQDLVETLRQEMTEADTEAPLDPFLQDAALSEAHAAIKMDNARDVHAFSQK